MSYLWYKQIFQQPYKLTAHLVWYLLANALFQLYAESDGRRQSIQIFYRIFQSNCGIR